MYSRDKCKHSHHHPDQNKNTSIILERFLIHFPINLPYPRVHYLFLPAQIVVNFILLSFMDGFFPSL